MLPNGWRLSGERSGAERVRCSRWLGVCIAPVEAMADKATNEEPLHRGDAECDQTHQPRNHVDPQRGNCQNKIDQLASEEPGQIEKDETCNDWAFCEVASDLPPKSGVPQAVLASNAIPVAVR